MSKDYGQFCGLAKATQALGERWALMVVRDLAVGPRRFTDLHEGLPGIPTTVLTTRLRELEAAGVVERRLEGRSVTYALTEYGQELTPILDALGRWGARRMLVPEATDTITSASLASALRAAHQPGRAPVGTTWLIRSGPATAWATSEGASVTVGAGEPPVHPDLTITAGPQMRALLAGRLTPCEALSSGAIETDGTPEDLDLFTRTFHVPLDADIA